MATRWAAARADGVTTLAVHEGDDATAVEVGRGVVTELERRARVAGYRAKMADYWRLHRITGWDGFLRIAEKAQRQAWAAEYDAPELDPYTCSHCGDVPTDHHCGLCFACRRSLGDTE